MSSGQWKEAVIAASLNEERQTKTSLKSLPILQHMKGLLHYAYLSFLST